MAPWRTPRQHIPDRRIYPIKCLLRNGMRDTAINLQQHSAPPNLSHDSLKHRSLSNEALSFEGKIRVGFPDKPRRTVVVDSIWAKRL